MASLPLRVVVMSGSGLLLGPMSESLAMMQPQSLSISLAPGTTNGREDRAVQTGPRPPLATTQRTELVLLRTG